MTSNERHHPPILEDQGDWGPATSWEFWRSRELTSEQRNFATAAFLVAIWDLETQSVVTQFNLSRQRYEIPGGHVDPGEDALAAAVREAREEGGIVAETSEIVPFGYRKIVNYQPHPTYPLLSYNPFFYTHLRRPLEEPTGDDVVEARVFTVEEMEDLVRTRRMQIGELAIIKTGLDVAYQDAMYGN